MPTIPAKRGVVTLSIERAWRLPPDVRDLIAHAHGMGLNVNVYCGAGLRPKRWVSISGNEFIINMLSECHPRCAVSPDKMYDLASEEEKNLSNGNN